jgi:predicted Zn-dependent protease
MKKIYCLFFILILAIFISGCSAVYNPLTNKKEMVLSTGIERALGKSISVEYELTAPISRNINMRKKVANIGAKIAVVSDRRDISYRYKVIKNKNMNAFAMPGGFIYVHSALVKKTTDAELAAVLAHETAHVAARHSVKSIQRALFLNGLLYLGTEAVDNRTKRKKIRKALGISLNLVLLGYGRNAEREADRLSVRYTKRAGYNPNAVVSMLMKLKKEENKLRAQGKVSVLNAIPIFRSHPKINERIKIAKEEIANSE